jgi:hypothetical protein
MKSLRDVILDVAITPLGQLLNRGAVMRAEPTEVGRESCPQVGASLFALWPSDLVWSYLQNHNGMSALTRVRGGYRLLRLPASLLGR